MADYDNDGWADIYVANDSTSSLLFMNNHDGTFRENGMLAGVAYDANGRTQGGMGADSADYDGDGFLDIVKTNFSDEMPNLYHNEGKAFFTDVTAPAGLGGETKSVKWGTGFIDFDDDGQPDILIVSGSIYPPGTGMHHQLPQTESKLILMRNIDGHRFANVSEQAGPAFLESRCGRGAAFGDIFNTGRIGIVVNNLNDYPSLLRNQSPSTNSWLLVKLIGTATNRAAIGSRVVLTANNRRQVQEVRSGGSFCSQNDLRLHFGLGDSERSSGANPLAGRRRRNAGACSSQSADRSSGRQRDYFPGSILNSSILLTTPPGGCRASRADGRRQRRQNAVATADEMLAL